MKRSRFTEEQILFALKQAAAGQPVADVFRNGVRNLPRVKRGRRATPPKRGC